MHWGVLFSAALVGLQSVPALGQCRVGQTTKLLASDASDGAAFGARLAKSDDNILIGAFASDGVARSSGSAYVFRADGGSWTQQVKLTASDAAELDWFGASVSLDHDLAVIGAIQVFNGGAGAVYTYRFDGVTWNEEAKLVASDAHAGDEFGSSVSVSGDTVIVGAPAKDVGAIRWLGAAYIFRQAGGKWTQIQKLTAPDSQASDRFGGHVSVEGNRVIVGATQFPDRSGAAYVYRNDGNEWILEATLTGSDSTSGDAFGNWISFDNGKILVGALAHNERAGSAYVFRHDGENWIEEAKLTASNAAPNAEFGSSVSLSGDFAVIGAQKEDDVASGSGAAYVFRFDGVNWNEQYKLTASDLWRPRNARFGMAVSLDGDVAVVGADGTDAFGDQTGSAYVFDISPPTDDRCDMNCDGSVDSMDIEPFLELLFNGATPCEPCVGDVNSDGNIDGFDIEPFLNCLFP